MKEKWEKWYWQWGVRELKGGLWAIGSLPSFQI